jgi:hypothetical protein
VFPVLRSRSSRIVTFDLVLVSVAKDGAFSIPNVLNH